MRIQNDRLDDIYFRERLDFILVSLNRCIAKHETGTSLLHVFILRNNAYKPLLLAIMQKVGRLDSAGSLTASFVSAPDEANRPIGEITIITTFFSKSHKLNFKQFYLM